MKLNIITSTKQVRYHMGKIGQRTMVAIFLTSSLAAHAQERFAALGLNQTFYRPNSMAFSKARGYGFTAQFGIWHDTGFLALRNSRLVLNYFEGAVRNGASSYGGSMFTGVDLTVKKINLGVAFLPIAAGNSKARFSLGVEVDLGLFSKYKGKTYTEEKFDSLPPNYVGPGYYTVVKILDTKNPKGNKALVCGAIMELQMAPWSKKGEGMHIFYQLFWGMMPEYSGAGSFSAVRQQWGMQWYF